MVPVASPGSARTGRAVVGPVTDSGQAPASRSRSSSGDHSVFTSTAITANRAKQRALHPSAGRGAVRLQSHSRPVRVRCHEEAVREVCRQARPFPGIGKRGCDSCVVGPISPVRVGPCGIIWTQRTWPCGPFKTMATDQGGPHASYPTQAGRRGDSPRDPALATAGCGDVEVKAKSDEIKRDKRSCERPWPKGSTPVPARATGCSG